MKTRLKLLFVTCCLIPSWLGAQEIEVKRERTFPATAMYGYMNGGTDQFLEYDVQKLTVIELIYKEEEYTVEIFDMPTPQDAFGIYSLHVFKCNRTDVRDGINCLSPYQLQAAAGNLYISIVFPSGSDQARIYADDVLQKYASDGNQETNFIPKLVETVTPVSGNLKYLRGPLSLTKASTSLAGLLKDVAYSNIWYSPDKATKTYKTLIYLPKRNETEKLKRILSADNILEEGQNYLYFKGDDKPEGKENTNDFGF